MPIGDFAVSITTISSREFNQDAGGAKKAADKGPVVITEWDATTIVPPRSAATVEEAGDLVIALEG